MNIVYIFILTLILFMYFIPAIKLLKYLRNFTKRFFAAKHRTAGRHFFAAAALRLVFLENFQKTGNYQ